MTQNIVEKNTSIQLINQVNCGTHVFQLAVNDALKVSNSLGTIDEVHNMCVLMRTQIVMIEIRKLECKVILPPLENDTRWNGKFLMVKCCLIRRYCDAFRCLSILSKILFFNFIYVKYASVIFAK